MRSSTAYRSKRSNSTLLDRSLNKRPYTEIGEKSRSGAELLNSKLEHALEEEKVLESRVISKAGVMQRGKPTQAQLDFHNYCIQFRGIGENLNARINTLEKESLNVIQELQSLKKRVEEAEYESYYEEMNLGEYIDNEKEKNSKRKDDYLW